MKTGLVIGKFYPPHKGHKYLINTAAQKVERLFVVVCERSDQEINAALRAEWIRTIHPNVEVLVADDIKKDNDPNAWGVYVKKLLGCIPDILFTSEDYGATYAKILGSRHVLVDKKREAVPISGTKIRKNPLRFMSYLEPCVIEYFLKK